MSDKIDMTLSAEQFEKRFGRKKTVGMFTLGCAKVKVDMIATMPRCQRARPDGKKTTYLG